MSGPRPRFLVHGPPAGAGVRRLRARGRAQDVAVLVEVWGAGAERAALEARLREAGLDAFAGAGGSSTSRARAAVGAIDAALRRTAATARPSAGPSAGEPPAPSGPLGAGLSLLVLEPDALLLAQCGPSLAFHRTPASEAGEPPQRLPESSPWLAEPRARLAADPVWCPLGPLLPDPAALQLHWRRLHGGAGNAILLCESRSRDALTPEVVAALLGTPPERVENALTVAVPAGGAALYVGWPAAEEGPRRAATASRAGAAGAAVAGATVTHDAEGAAARAPEEAARGADPGEPAGSPNSPPGTGEHGDHRAGEAVGAGATVGAADDPAHASPAVAAGTPRAAGRDPALDDASTTSPRISALTAALAAGGAALAASWAALRGGAARRAPAVSAGASRAGRRAARDGARVVLGLFPSRSPSRIRHEATRIAAVVAIALPVVLLAAALWWGWRSGREANAGPEPLAAQSGAAEAPQEGLSATVAAATAAVAAQARASSEAAQAAPAQSPEIRRLADAELVAALAGEPGQRRALVVTEEARFVLNRDRNTVERLTSSTVTPRVVLEGGQTVGDRRVGRLVDLAWLPARGGGGLVAALDDGGGLWEVAAAPRALPLGETPQLGAPRLLAGYDGQLYVLDDGGSVFRFAAAGEGGDPSGGFPGAGEVWLQGQDFARATDLAVDGTLFVSFEDGRIGRWQAGAPAPFELAGLAPGLETPLGLYTSGTAGRLLVADAGHGRLLDLSPAGQARARLLLEPLSAAREGSPAAEGRFELPQALAWNEAEGSLWIVDGDALYRAAFDRR